MLEVSDVKITESFVADILKKEDPKIFQKVYDNSPMLQYLDKKMKAVHGNSKASYRIMLDMNMEAKEE